MMMRMLEAGGIPALTDELREADEDNPKGYYEFERVKQLPEDSAWLPDAQGKAVKMVFALLKDLPEGYEYKVVFMRRPLEEVLASQKKMLERQGRLTDISDEEIAHGFKLLLDSTLDWVAKQPHFMLREVWYNAVLESPQEELGAIADFLGQDLDVNAMQNIIDTNLYRNRLAE